MDRASRRDMVMAMLAKEPHDLFLNYALAMEFIAGGEWQQAEAQLLTVLEIDAAHLPCYYQLGKVYEALNQIAKALVYYRQGIALAQQQGNKKALGELNEALWMLDEE